MTYEWQRLIQEMTDAIDVHITRFADGSLTLNAFAERMGYSPFHLTRQFHQQTGMTMRSYVRLRRLAFAAIDVRDTTTGLLEIALRYGFGSQAAFTRAFKKAFAITPGEYRRRPQPLVLQIKINTFDPYFLGIAGKTQTTATVQKLRVYSQVCAAHRFMHVRNAQSHGYWDFWAKQEKIPGQDCNTICGLLDSINEKLDGNPEVIGKFSGQAMAYLEEQGQRFEAYGVRLPYDWAGAKPEQMLMLDVPAGEYMVFEHPPFDYEKCGGAVSEWLFRSSREFDYYGAGLAEDPTRPTYFLFEPARCGQILKAVRRIVD
jgi:AraC-like DNA-binding protein